MYALDTTRYVVDITSIVLGVGRRICVLSSMRYVVDITSIVLGWSKVTDLCTFLIGRVTLSSQGAKAVKFRTVQLVL